MHKPWPVYITGQHSAIKRNRLFIPATAWTDLKGIMLLQKRKKFFFQKGICTMIPLIQYFLKDRLVELERIDQWLPEVWGKVMNGAAGGSLEVMEEFCIFFLFFFKRFVHFMHLLFGCAGSSLLHAGFLPWWRAGAALQLRCSGFALRWLLKLQSMSSRMRGLSSRGPWA